MNNKVIIFLTSVAVISFFFNGFVDFSQYQIDKVYLTVSTFLFTVFNGFFISRQSARYTEIRNSLSRFDADMSIIFRESTHFDDEEHAYIATLIREYYAVVLSHKNWSYYYFTHKTNLISSLHEYLQVCAKKSVDGLRGEVIKSILHTLDDVQITRKLLVSLKEETIPRLQQVFIYMLAAILLLAILTLPSAFLVLASLIKTVYIVSVFTVVILLKKFDDLSLFEGAIGEHSARDVLDIIDGKK